MRVWDVSPGFRATHRSCVADAATVEEKRVAYADAAGMLAATRLLATRRRESFLLSSTALGDLGAYVHTAESAPGR